MRKIKVLSFVSLDGVVQAPGGPDEDTTSGFKHGGWTFYYFDDFAGKIMNEQLSTKYDLLLGRKTYDIFASYWPDAPDNSEPIKSGFNKARKYVISTTLKNPSWENTTVININVANEIKKLKEGSGPELQVHGSGNMIQTLLKNDLVDELLLKIFPITLGYGKRLFEEGTIPKAFELFDSQTSPSGVIFCNFRKGGEVRTGSFAESAKQETTK